MLAANMFVTQTTCDSCGVSVISGAGVVPHGWVKLVVGKDNVWDEDAASHVCPSCINLLARFMRKQVDHERKDNPEELEHLLDTPDDVTPPLQKYKNVHYYKHEPLPGDFHPDADVYVTVPQTPEQPTVVGHIKLVEVSMDGKPSASLDSMTEWNGVPLEDYPSKLSTHREPMDATMLIGNTRVGSSYVEDPSGGFTPDVKFVSDERMSIDLSRDEADVSDIKDDKKCEHCKKDIFFVSRQWYHRKTTNRFCMKKGYFLDTVAIPE